MSDFLQIQTTTASAEDAERIARALVEQRQAACVQISGPIKSVYRWQGTVEMATEWRLTIKTTAARFAAAAATIRESHTYEMPELIATPIAEGSAEYLEWIQGETTE